LTAVEAGVRQRFNGGVRVKFGARLKLAGCGFARCIGFGVRYTR
jgi:hypothetical protein